MADNRPGKELVIRGGAGIFFDTPNQQALSAFHGAGFYASQAYPGVRLPVYTGELDVPAASRHHSPTHLSLPFHVICSFRIACNGI